MLDGATPRSTRPPRGPATWSLRRRLVVLYLVVGFVLAGAFAATIVVLVGVSNTETEQIDRIDPSDLAASDLLAGLLDQQNSVRGYALARQRLFLPPYRQGLAEETDAEGRLRALFGQDPRDALSLAAVEARAMRWRADFAEPVISAPDGGPQPDPALGKALFDQVRSAYDDLHAGLADSRRRAGDRLHTATTVLIALASITAGLLLVAAGVLAAALQRWLLRPLDTLSADARAVAAGALGHRVMATGPPELQRLAGDVEAMRERLVDEYADAVVAQKALAEAAEQLRGQADELLRSNTDLEQFAYVASHDLQEPLRKVASFTQLLAQRYHGQLDERADQYIDFAVDGAKRMQQLINDLLAFSRVGRATISLVPVDLDAVLAVALDRLQTRIAEAGAEVTSGGLPTVPGDATLLTQLLQNLVGNALKFHSEQAPVVRIEAVSRGDVWEVCCSDNGIGIEPRFADKVFVIFQRLHGRDRYEGTGIGLSLCKKIVEFHGGRIWVDSEQTGPGTTIRFTLAAAAAAPAGSEPEEDL